MEVLWYAFDCAPRSWAVLWPHAGTVTIRSDRLQFHTLQDFRIPGEVSVYELQNHRIVDGRKDFLRLNFYLTKDHNCVTIWRGLLDLLLTEAEFESGRMASVKLPDHFVPQLQ
jgi:hypothetical protein